MKTMKKTTLTILAVAFATSFAIAQTVEEGIKFLYYERVSSAKQTLEKVVASKPKDALSIYWLGQAYLDDKDVAKTKALYQKALADGVNDPWIWVGSGHVELLENGDVNSAKQKFEQAITATKGKKGVENADILNAIGRANADGSSTQGDPLYGIEKLKKAQEINKTNPDIDINLGKCYLKQGPDGGGQAVEAFRDAITRNPQYAQAYFRTGRIYQNQNNLEFMNEWYGKAIAADPSYAPVYLAYFEYYKERDVNAAKEYLDKFVANADKDCQVDYFVADYLYRAGKNLESIAKAKEMENGACKDFVRVNVLYAYNYDKMGDSATAKTYIEKFFASATPEKIEPSDYVLASKVLTKFPGSGLAAVDALKKAIELDTAKAKQMEYMTQISAILSKEKMYTEQIELINKMIALKGKATSRDYYDLCKASADGKFWSLLDGFSKQYITAYPDLPQGYTFNVTANKMTDVDTTKGLAVEPVNNYINFLKKDIEKNRKTIYNSYYYLLVYYAQYAKDLQKGIEICDSMIELYPDPASEENKFPVTTKDQLQKALQKKTGTGSTSPAKPNTGGGSKSN